MPLVNAAIETMQSLLDGHPKAMKIRKVTIARYAASLIGYYRGKLSLPKSKISNHEKLDNFIKLFVRKLFISNGKIQNIKLFTQLFGIELLEERVSLEKVKHNPSPASVLKYSIQKRPLSDFQTASNLKQLRNMSINKMKLLLTPRGRFNPKLVSLNELRAQQHAITLTKKFARTMNAGKRLALATLVEQLQKTENLNRELLKNIRKHSS
tara:strand:+ start:1008 stop:1637 length:630 start_codon:yes stop_codon:yes gene_type:complete